MDAAAFQLGWTDLPRVHSPGIIDESVRVETSLLPLSVIAEALKPILTLFVINKVYQLLLVIFNLAQEITVWLLNES